MVRNRDHLYQSRHGDINKERRKAEADQLCVRVMSGESNKKVGGWRNCLGEWRNSLGNDGVTGMMDITIDIGSLYLGTYILGSSRIGADGNGVRYLSNLLVD